MGGSGKTTLAKYIYNSNWKKFENTSFVENIGSRCKESHHLLELQKQLLKDILGGRKRKIPSVSQGTCKIEEALRTKRTLIVLDDIVEESQLVDLLGTGKINAKSKIIITTENSDNWFKFSSTSCQQYKMKLLNYDESLALLSRHAFGSEILKEGFKDLAAQAVKYCEGNPLAIEVLGSSLSNGNTIPYWKSQLGVLTKDIHSRIQDVLKRGYDLLPYPSEKELFLHIACFFIGKDMEYVEKILEPDYAAVSGIKTLTARCLISISPRNKLTMHRLLQEMGRNIVRNESFKYPVERSRVWLNEDSYKILKKGKGSKTIEGFTLDLKMLREEERVSKSSELKIDAFIKMDNLKLLQLNFVELTGSHKNFSEDLRWLCWFGFHLRTIPTRLYMGNMVAVDMSYSNLEVFEPPMVLHSLKILNLKDSHNLFEIRNMSMIPYLETLIVWNCHNLVRVCEIGDLKSLTQLNMTGCKNLCVKEQKDMPVRLSSSSGVTGQPPFSFPYSLQQLFLNDCIRECTNSFPLSFSDHPFLQYLNLGNGLFELLPCYDHLINLRVLDLSFCSSLKWLLCLPNTLAELYIYYCTSLEKVTFQSPRFMLQEFGYEGCINLAEIEGFIKLLPIAKLDETDLGHLKWLKKYQSHEVLLVGDDELTVGRSLDLQMLYEFNIMSTSLPDIKDSKATPEYISDSPSLSFDVPSCPKNRRLTGLNVSLKYTLLGDIDWAWFAKVSTTNGVDLMYNPKVFGKPRDGEVGIWLSYWPIGSSLDIGDTVNVSIAVMSGLEVHECGATLVYSDDEIAEETLENNMGWEETLGGDLSGFQLSTGAYYLCRRDFFELMEVDRLTPDWFRILVGDTIDYTEVRGWRKTGRPKQSNPSFTELKTVRCIIHDPGAEEIYNLLEMSKSSLLDKKTEFTSSKLEGRMKSGTTYEISDEATKDKESEPPSLQGSQSCRRFTFPEIQLATHNFDASLVIGSGGFGKVYKGNVIDGSSFGVAAIKRLDSMSNQGAAEFWIEVEMLSRLRHYNLVSLIGYCNYDKEMILVYEYMSNGSLDDHLHKLGTPLPWLQRLKICINAARGLDYLHTSNSIERGVMHRDVKSSNILLDENWVAKISDFGLSRKVATNQPSTYLNDNLKGTFGYMDPQYFYTGRLTRKSDVYSFGVVLLEMLCRKRAIDTTRDEEQRGLAIWAQESIRQHSLKHIIDSDISGQISPKCLREFVQIVERCLHIDPKQRPTMAEVVVSLEYLLTSQEKFNNSLQPAIRTIFGRVLDMIGFPSKGDNSAQRDSSTSVGNTVEADHNMFLETREVPADCKVPSLKKFKFADLRRATNNFSGDMLLGRGGFGSEFLGWVDENTFAPSTVPGVGISVVVMRHRQGSRQGQEQWQAEVDMLGQLAHPNIVSLLGYCNDEYDEYFLVYEYMQNGTLDSHLYPTDIAAEPLSWRTRLRIMIGVARGLTYLHSSNVIHSEVKSRDIFLDQDFNAKLRDLGVGRFSPETRKSYDITTFMPMGTSHYLDPEYFMTGQLSVKSDVYSFGVVLLQTLTGLQVNDMNRPDEQRYLVPWAIRVLEDNEKLKEIIDPRLERNYPEEGVFEYAKLALRCLAMKSKDRPSSEEVLSTLEQILLLEWKEKS